MAGQRGGAVSRRVTPKVVTGEEYLDGALLSPPQLGGVAVSPGSERLELPKRSGSRLVEQATGPRHLHREEGTDAAQVDQVLRAEEMAGRLPDLELVVLFGSTAKGRRRAESDVDVAVRCAGTADLDTLYGVLAPALGTDRHPCDHCRKTPGWSQQPTSPRRSRPRLPDRAPDALGGR